MHFPIHSKAVRMFLAVLIVVVACKKETRSSQNDVPDNKAPVITINTPTESQSFAAGQTLQVSATATDDYKVTELHVHVLDKSTGVLLRDIHSFPGTKEATVTDSFTADNPVGYTIKIIAYDPAQNLATAQVQVTVN